jgi:hypothetical protein
MAAQEPPISISIQVGDSFPSRRLIKKKILQHLIGSSNLALTIPTVENLWSNQESDHQQS